MAEIRFDCRVGYFTAADQSLTDWMPTNSIDLSERVMKMTVRHHVGIGEVGVSTCEVTVDNSDGAFTPSGGGAYDDWDWHSSNITVRSRYTDYATPPLTGDFGWMFLGLVSDVEFVDDGFTSEVTLTCLDPFTLLSRYIMEEDVDAIGLVRTASVIFNNIAYGTSPATLAVRDRMPSLGSVEQQYLFCTNSVHSTTLVDEARLDFDIAQGDFLGDALEDVIAAEAGVFYPMQSYTTNALFPPYPAGEDAGNGAQGVAIHYLLYDPHLGIRGASHDYDLSVTPSSRTGVYDPHIVYLKPTTASMGDHILPYRDLQIGFNIDEHVNQVLVSNGVDEAFLTNETAVQQYGPRAVELTNLPLRSSDTDSEARCDDLARSYINKFSGVDFTVQSVSISGAMIEQYATGWIPRVLLRFSAQPSINGNGGIGRAIAVTYAPAGLSERTDYVVFKDEVVEITPQDWTMTLSNGVKATNFISFIFDDPLTGVLGTGRLAGLEL